MIYQKPYEHTINFWQKYDSQVSRVFFSCVHVLTSLWSHVNHKPHQTGLLHQKQTFSLNSEIKKKTHVNHNPHQTGLLHQTFSFSSEKKTHVNHKPHQTELLHQRQTFSMKKENHIHNGY